MLVRANSSECEFEMRRRYAIAVSALTLALHFGTPASAAAPTLEELGLIADLLDANDVEALRAYLLLRPWLLEGDTVLAELLREYMEESRDVAAFLGVRPSLPPDFLASMDESDDFEGFILRLPIISEEPDPGETPPELY